MDLKVSEIINSRLNELQGPKNEKIDEDFSFTLKKITSKDGLQERLQGLYDDIKATGAKLTDRLSLTDLKEYRSKVSEFMNEVVTNSHEFSRQNFLDKRGRHRVYGIVKHVDKNLDELASELMKSEKDKLKILEKVDEINGLLIDVLI